MMPPNKYTIFIARCVIGLGSLLLPLHNGLKAQTMHSIQQEEDATSQVKRNLHWGFSAQFMWSTIQGPQLQEVYFAKPSLGVGVRGEYYFLPFLGVAAGLGLQQRGAGIINPDQSGGAYSNSTVTDIYGNPGNPDSTHLQKIRFSTLELPVSILFQTPRDVLKGIRLSGAAGLVYIHNFESNLVFESVADGNHVNQPVTSDYLRNDLGYQVSAGINIHFPETGSEFQIHYVYSAGFGNIYSIGPGKGSQVAYGLRLTCLFP